MDMNREGTVNNETQPTGEKTFTQDQVNAIVGERLAKEKTRSEAALVQREQELNKRELKLEAKEKLAELGLPLELLDAVDISTRENLDKALNTFQAAFAKQRKEMHKINVEERKLPLGQSLDVDPNRQLRKAMRLPD